VTKTPTDGIADKAREREGPRELDTDGEREGGDTTIKTAGKDRIEYEKKTKGEREFSPLERE